MHELGPGADDLMATPWQHIRTLASLAAGGLIARPLNALRRAAIVACYKIAALFIPSRDPSDEDGDGQPG